MTRPTRRFACASSLLALAVAAPALAQEAPPAAPAELDEIVVTGSQVRLTSAYAGGQVARGGRVGLLGNMDVMDTPYSTSNYTEKLIRDQQARGIGDVLQNDPTVRVSKGFGNFQELYVIRGFPVFSDDMSYNGLYGVLPRQFVAAELIERVEVFRGASAFLNGAAPGGTGVGGAFNLTPKRAGEPLTRLTAGVSGNDEIYAAADLARRFGTEEEWGARLNLVSRDGEGSVENENGQLRVVGLGLDRRGERARFSADLGWQDHRIDAPRPSVTPGAAIPDAPSADKNFAQHWTYTDEEQLFGAVRGEFDLTDSVTAWAAFGGRQGKEDNSLANPRADAAGAIRGYRFDNIREDTVWSGDIGVRADLTTGPVEHRLVASASQIQSKSKNAWAASSFSGYAFGTLSNPTLSPAPAITSVSGDLDDPNVTERVKHTSVAVADVLSFLDGRVLATVGVRYQEIETKSYAYADGAFGSGYSSDATTPAFALVYKPSDKISLYANYAEALVPGTTAPAVVNGVTVANGGEVLSPFRAEQAEVGAKYDAGSFGGTLSVFRTTLPSAYFDPDTAIYSDGGEQENQGVELTVYGEPVAGLRLIGGATWLEAEINRSLTAANAGKSAIGVPDFQINANVEWDVPMVSGLTLEGRAVHTGAQPANATNTLELEEWTRFDAGLRYAFVAGGKDLTVRARVENIADEDQWVAVGGYPGSNYLTLGAPRTFRLSVSAEF
ncbi:TonB-dependent receptor [Brevundimonas sp. EAKA]|uniref:Ferrichrome receptor FcuA n=1 Tax=Brevundimonas mediterranea TaxID=74329 RepID=A0A7Z8Y104_9CAUL|nr:MULTISPECIES: TonB-dependent receptor [Brevundimonas]KDP94417.1 TonB-dependent receptor [Brevundimonas sp. EAKA]MBU4195429.1 TonB-dependent receptor [Alphaproteobacteria bacterium]MCG2664246.1 TonB-dependent receptor [Brevundimonas sp.]VDC48860.1 Ferrichrome receptor FcuA [Brevundimonas mediterranea]